VLLPCPQLMLPLLHPDQQNDVHVLGLHGIKGVGKSTLAYALFRQLSGSGLHFSHRIDLDVGEQAKLYKKQRQLIDKLTGPNRWPEATSQREQQQQLEQCVRLGGPLLLFVDNIYTEAQRDALLCLDALQPGSRVLLTACDIDVLPDESRVCMRRPVHFLAEAPAKELLCWHAFATAAAAIDPGQQETVRLALAHCGGLPLDLKTVGCALRGRARFKSAVSRLCSDCTTACYCGTPMPLDHEH
jgi:predicted kinase